MRGWEAVWVVMFWSARRPGRDVLVGSLVWEATSATRSLVVTPSLHPVAADGHRAPAGPVGRAPVDQEQTALVVRARPQAAGTVADDRVPGQNRAHRQQTLGPDSECPRELIVNVWHVADSTEEGTERRRGFVAADDALQRSSGSPQVCQLGSAAKAAGADHPCPRRLELRQVVRGDSVDDWGAVQDGQQEVVVSRTESRTLTNPCTVHRGLGYHLPAQPANPCYPV
jgi:hypothetical protein